MRHRAVGLWAGFLMLGAAALVGAVLLVSGPAAALAPYGPASGAGNVTATTVAGRWRPRPRPHRLPRALTSRVDGDGWRRRHRGGRDARPGDAAADRSELA